MSARSNERDANLKRQQTIFLSVCELYSDGLDRSTVHGFFMKFSLQMHVGYSYLLIMSAVTTFFAGNCYYIRACGMAFKRTFDQMDEAIATGGRDSMQRTASNMKRAIVFHIKIMK